MTDVIIHGVPGSPYLRSALLVLEEKSVPYRLMPMAPAQSKEPAYLAKHPFGRVPLLEHADFTLYETQAILRYVDEAFDGPALQPTDPRAAARMNQLLGIVDWYVFRDISATIVFNRVIAPFFGMPTNEQVVIDSLPKAEICVRALAGLLGDREWFAGDALSLADLHLVPQLEFLTMTPEGANLLAPAPNLLAWVARLQQRPSLQRTTMQALTAG